MKKEDLIQKEYEILAETTSIDISQDVLNALNSNSVDVRLLEDLILSNLHDIREESFKIGIIKGIEIAIELLLK